MDRTRYSLCGDRTRCSLCGGLVQIGREDRMWYPRCTKCGRLPHLSFEDLGEAMEWAMTYSPPLEERVKYFISKIRVHCEDGEGVPCTECAKRSICKMLLSNLHTTEEPRGWKSITPGGSVEENLIIPAIIDLLKEFEEG